MSTLGAAVWWLNSLAAVALAATAVNLPTAMRAALVIGALAMWFRATVVAHRG